MRDEKQVATLCRVQQGFQSDGGDLSGLRTSERVSGKWAASEGERMNGPEGSRRITLHPLRRIRYRWPRVAIGPALPAAATESVSSKGPVQAS